MMSALARPIVRFVSPPYASGQMWFTNALTWLNVETRDDDFYKTIYRREVPFWIKTPQGLVVNEEIIRPALNMLPILWDREVFNFDPAVEIRYSHRLDRAKYRDARFILLLRDPRDALYSEMRRNPVPDMREEEMGEQYLRYLRTPHTQDNNFGHTLTLRPLDMWCVFTAFWLRMQAFLQVKLVIFEDCKKAPAATLANLMDYIGIRRTAQEIDLAVEMSTVEKFRISDQKARDKYGDSGRVNVRKGQPGEWRTRNPSQELPLFDGVAAGIMEAVGYDVSMHGHKVPLSALFGTEESAISRMRCWLTEEEERVRRSEIAGGERALLVNRISYLLSLITTNGDPKSDRVSLAVFGLFGNLFDASAHIGRDELMRVMRESLEYFGVEAQDSESMVPYIRATCV